MNATLARVLTTLTFGDPQRYKNVAVEPLFSDAPETVSYTTLARAARSTRFKISEVSENGSVPNLRLVNDLDEGVLLIDGEELMGARQNRVLNATILAPAHSELVIPVSCTEQGRWSHMSDHFDDSDLVMAARHRAAKSADVHRSLAESRSYRSDQAAVWSRVEDMHNRLGTRSATGAMRDAYSSRHEQLDHFAAAFPSVAGQKGLAVTVDGQLLGLEFVSRVDAYADLHTRLIKSYAMETMLQPEGAPPSTAPAGDAAALIERLSDALESKHKSVGAGWDFRYAGPNLVGSAVVVDEEAIHLAIFRVEAETGSDASGRRPGFSQRMRFRTQSDRSDEEAD